MPQVLSRTKAALQVIIQSVVCIEIPPTEVHTLLFVTRSPSASARRFAAWLGMVLKHHPTRRCGFNYRCQLIVCGSSLGWCDHSVHELFLTRVPKLHEQ